MKADQKDEIAPLCNLIEQALKQGVGDRETKLRKGEKRELKGKGERGQRKVEGKGKSGMIVRKMPQPHDDHGIAGQHRKGKRRIA